MTPHGTSVHTTMCCIKGVLWHGPVTPPMRQQGWSSIIIPQWIKMSISAHSNIPSAALWRWATAYCTSNSPVHHPLCTCMLSDTSRGTHGGSGTCLETTSASPWWPAELSQLRNQGHTRRGLWFYHNKDFSTAAACNWLQEMFQSIFC